MYNGFCDDAIVEALLPLFRRTLFIICWGDHVQWHSNGYSRSRSTNNLWSVKFGQKNSMKLALIEFMLALGPTMAHDDYEARHKR